MARKIEMTLPPCRPLEYDKDGNVVGYKACFAPGTLVHTDQGLVPIEEIHVGM
jgi:hypothetical protein